MSHDTEYTTFRARLAVTVVLNKSQSLNLTPHLSKYGYHLYR